MKHALLTAALCCAPVLAGTLSGRIVDVTGKPVTGAAVKLDKSGASAVSDAQGKFSLATVALVPAPEQGALPPMSAPAVDAPASYRFGARLFTALGRLSEEAPAPAISPAAYPARHAALRRAAWADTLSLAKAAYLPRRLLPAGPDVDLGDLILYPALPGAASKYLGFDQYNFTVAGKPCLVVAPKNPRPGNPWIWRTYFWNHKPLFDSIMCSQGYYLAFMDAPNLYGAPQAVALMDSFYVHLTTHYGMNRKPTLFGISRGAYYMYNWSRDNVDKISSLYGDGAGMDYVSWPCGCYGTGTGSAGDWATLKTVFGFKTDAEAKAYRGNPYQGMKPLALAKIPIIHVYGEADDVAPPNENVLKANDSLKAYGWQMKLLSKPKTGHVHGVTAGDGGLPGQLDTLVAFVLRNTAP